MLSKKEATRILRHFKGTRWPRFCAHKHTFDAPPVLTTNRRWQTRVKRCQWIHARFDAATEGANWHRTGRRRGEGGGEANNELTAVSKAVVMFFKQVKKKIFLVFLCLFVTSVCVCAVCVRAGGWGGRGRRGNLQSRMRPAVLASKCAIKVFFIITSIVITSPLSA